MLPADTRLVIEKRTHMIIGHAPAGYVISRLLLHRFCPGDIPVKIFLWCGVIGAIAPDIDMLYFHLVDHRQHHHHSYVSHFPIVWFSLVLLSFLWVRWAKNKYYAVLACIFSVNGFVHLFLDTLVGDVWWFAPFIDRSFAFFSVPVLYKLWWLNFLLHWSFAVELAILVWALYLWRQPLRRPIGGAWAMNTPP